MPPQIPSSPRSPWRRPDLRVPNQTRPLPPSPAVDVPAGGQAGEGGPLRGWTSSLPPFLSFLSPPTVLRPRLRPLPSYRRIHADGGGPSSHCRPSGYLQCQTRLPPC